MNANELAKKIENYCYWSVIDFHYIKESADMLRQQQAEIEALKQTIEWLADINEMRFLELSDGELPVLYVTLNHNGNRIQGNVSLQETRIICNSIAHEIKKKSTSILRKASEK